MSRLLTIIVGGAAGGAALLVIFAATVWCYCTHWKALRNKNSETTSSDPSTFVGNNGAVVVSCGAPNGQKGARQFTIEELEEATKNFGESNLVGVGSFGSVYKGLLLDGTVVAVKRRQAAPRPEFVEEVARMSTIWHRNLVTLIGYCQENGLQILVYEYLPNGSIPRHLYDIGQNSVSKLEFKQRLSVALGAAKGLSYLHSLSPPLVHKSFKTSNVLVDENFIAKVADAGIMSLLQRVEGVGPSQSVQGQIFRDPEVRGMERVSETSDVYSYGVFLLELTVGQDVEHHTFPLSNQSLAQWVQSHLGSADLIDSRLATTFTPEGMKEFIGLTLRCLNPSGRARPKMEAVVKKLDQILEREMTLTTVMGDSNAIVTLGSQLFSS